MKNTYEFVEDNGGGLFLFVFQNGDAIAGIENLEYSGDNVYQDIVSGLQKDALAEIADWSERIENPEEVHDELMANRCEIVANDSGVYPHRMGRAAETFFGVESE